MLIWEDERPSAMAATITRCGVGPNAPGPPHITPGLGVVVSQVLHNGLFQLFWFEREFIKRPRPGALPVYGAMAQVAEAHQVLRVVGPAAGTLDDVVDFELSG